MLLGSKACSTAGVVAELLRMAQRIALLVPTAESDGVVPGWPNVWLETTDGEIWNCPVDDENGYAPSGEPEAAAYSMFCQKSGAGWRPLLPPVKLLPIWESFAELHLPRPSRF